MHEMRKSDALQQHPHRHVDGRKDVYGVHKLNDKDHHKSIGSSASGRTERDHRSSKAPQIPGAIRICGDWSEHLSSNGKNYFFNNKTKSSQWERPKEWSNSRAIEIRKDKLKALHNRAGSKHSAEGSSSSHHAVSRQHKAGSSQGADAKKVQAQQQQQQARHRTNHEGQGGKDFRDRDYRTTSNSSAKDRDYRDIDYRDSRSSDSRVANSSEDKDYRSSNSNQHDNRPNLVRQSSEAGRLLGKDYNGKTVSLTNNVSSSQHCDTLTDNKDVGDGSSLRHTRDERSKSSSSTPRAASDGTKADQKVRTSTESDDRESSSAANGSEKTPTSAFVQTLSTVLNQASMSTSEDGLESTSLEGNLKNALQMLLTVAAQNQQITAKTEEESKPPEKEEPPTKRVRPSNPADEHITNSLVVCQSAGKVLEDLKGLFDERHTMHIQGWPADQMERQSIRLCDENHQFMVNHTSQLSASMKVARSQVRSAEIHSTLQEQRILYLRQQVKDLEKSTTAAPFT